MERLSSHDIDCQQSCFGTSPVESDCDNSRHEFAHPVTNGDVYAQQSVTNSDNPANSKSNTPTLSNDSEIWSD